MNGSHYPLTTEELLEQISQKARAYVPEWRLDWDNPDIGAALARVFAAMQEKTGEKYRRLPEKFRRDFFNCLNTSMRASAPAKGYVVFSMVNDEVPGTDLLAGTALRTEVTDEQGERIPVETTEDVYVLPDTLDAIYTCSDREDYIGACADGEEGGRGFVLFGNEQENRQEHVFYLGHPVLLSIRRYGRICLTFYQKTGQLISEDVLQALADGHTAEFFYPTAEGECPFTRVRVREGQLELEKTADMPPWEEREFSGVSSFWLGCRIHQRKRLGNFSFEELFLSADCPEMEPESIYADGSEAPTGMYFPFGGQPSVYDEVYFASDEVLGKKGAWVELSFWQEFVKVPADAPKEESPVRWRLIMPKEDVFREKEYEISIEEVNWEYFNGLGWTSLFADHAYGDCFKGAEGHYRQHRRIGFTCPEDIAPVLVNARESYYIRARIRKMNHAFKVNAYYLAPVLSGTALKYSYPLQKVSPLWFYEKNNMEEKLFAAASCMGAMKPFCPVYGTNDQTDTLYLGFRRNPRHGPWRMLFVTERDFQEKLPSLTWEYYRGGLWENLHPADETENFAKSGAVTFSGIPEAEKLSLFGRSLYWIRIRDKEGAYARKGVYHPVIQGIWMNTARVRTVKSGLEAKFTMESYQKEASFTLPDRNIHQLEVWVLENDIRREERVKLSGEGRLEEVKDGDGTLRETWVRWLETDQFLYHLPLDRCYLLDANDGVITFGGGIHGAIPAPGVPEGIHVRYSTGGGKACNLPAGAVNGLELSAGFIQRVQNPLPLFGGYDRETAREAEERAGRALGHRFQAATAQDYLALAKEATRNIEKAACFSGMDALGKKKPGTVTLVILKKDYRTGGRFFDAVRQEIQEKLRDSLAVGVAFGQNLFIREPLFARLEVVLTAQVKSFSEMFAVRRGIEQTLDDFLDPVSGNFDGQGWEIGSFPDQTQLETRIKGVPGLMLLKRCMVFACLENGPEKPRVDLGRLGEFPYVLPVGGSYEIQVVVQ